MILKEYYEQIIRHDLLTKFNYKTHKSIPKINKIVLNIGLKDVKKNYTKILLHLLALKIITKQSALVTKARKSVGGFNLRKGAPIGAKVTLRKNLMFDFLSEFITFIVPNNSKLKYFNSNSFDNKGNLSLNCSNITLFDDINNLFEMFFFENFLTNKGMQIAIETTSKKKVETIVLLSGFQLKFKNK